LTYFAVIVIVIGSAPIDAALAAGLLVLVPSYIEGNHVSTWLQLGFGIAAMVAAIANGRVAALARMRARVGQWFVRQRAAQDVAAPLAPTRSVGASSLEVDALQVRFGGVVAVADLSLSARTGSVTGLIGPNGAGKTTTFDACSGLVRPTRWTRPTSRASALRSGHGSGWGARSSGPACSTRCRCVRT
jgi:ABC-type multidrug transport system fused ATPase/permease subunit